MITYLTIALVLLPAFIFGLIEQFNMKHGLYIGKPNFGPFKLEYHGLLLLIALLNCYAAGGLVALKLVAGWAWFEDMGFFAGNKILPLNKDRWINFGMGGFNIPIINQWVPYTYLLLAALFIIGILI